MNRKKLQIYRLHLNFKTFVLLGAGLVSCFLIAPTGSSAHHASDCSDVYTPLSSFVTNGVNNNKASYVQVMNETGVPWEMLAAIHYRETNFGRTNPGNGQGIFQFVNGDGGPYPPGPVGDAEFTRQLRFMANRVQDDYVHRGSVPRERRRLVPNESNVAIVKDTLFSYNGRASAYVSQAQHFNYDPGIQPYEGSPYVMNRFDCSRARMGIITRDYGIGIDSSDTRYGAFTVYARLKGDAYWLSLSAPYIWSYVNQWAYADPARTKKFTSTPTTTGGGKTYVRIEMRNIGSKTWNRDTLRLGTSRPYDRNSIFVNADWLSGARATSLREHSVAPGQVGSFEFTLQSPLESGTYSEYFNLLVEGQTWLNDLGLFFTINVNSPSNATNTVNTGLGSGKTIKGNQFLMSPDAQSVLGLGRNSSLILYSNFRPTWTVPSDGKPGGKLVMQGDGNLVLYNSAGSPVWNTETQGNPGAWLAVQTDGNLVVYSATNTPLWASYTIHTPDHLYYVNTLLPAGYLYPGQTIETADRRYKLIHQTDGNVVLYNQSRQPVWATGTNNRQTAFLALQSDGNVVLYDDNYLPLWQTGSSGSSASKWNMQPDGNLVLYTRDNRPVWASGTVGR